MPAATSSTELSRQHIRDTLGRMRPGLLNTMPSHLDSKFVERTMHLALQVWDENDYLRRCEPRSFVRAVARCVQVGLEPNSPTQQAYLVPRDGKACLEIHGRGWARMAMQQGVLKRLDWNIVYASDDFDECYGTDSNNFVRHRPHFDGNPGEVVAAYALGTYPDGFQDHFTLPRWRLEEMAAKSAKLQKKAEAVSWRDNFEGMAGAKVCKWFFKRRCIGLDPLLHKAIEADDAADLGEPPQGDPELKEAEVAVTEPPQTPDDVLAGLATPEPEETAA